MKSNFYFTQTISENVNKQQRKTNLKVKYVLNIHAVTYHHCHISSHLEQHFHESFKFMYTPFNKEELNIDKLKSKGQDEKCMLQNEIGITFILTLQYKMIGAIP